MRYSRVVSLQNKHYSTLSQIYRCLGTFIFIFILSLACFFFNTFCPILPVSPFGSGLAACHIDIIKHRSRERITKRSVRRLRHRCGPKIRRTSGHGSPEPRTASDKHVELHAWPYTIIITIIYQINNNIIIITIICMWGVYDLPTSR